MYNNSKSRNLSMSTNYYCEFITSRRKLHVGKRSNGYVFVFQAYPDMGIFDYNDWVDLSAKYAVKYYDEYDKEITWPNLVDIIKDSYKNKENKSQFVEAADYKDAMGYEFCLWDFC